MDIREYEPRDISQIIQVLKAALGETSSKKTRELWTYKHLENPFGKSLIFVAVDKGKVIGVRAFMRWQWRKGDKIFETFRAVDTATHPLYQRKGVFNKLTLYALRIATMQGDYFIFNTPNSQSLPGYLKMGWNEVGKLKIRFLVTNPLSFLNKKQTAEYRLNNYSSSSQFRNLISKYNDKKVQDNKLFTLKSPEYLTWRYENNPIQKYEVNGDEDFYFAGHIKEHKYFKELRISEHIYYNESGLKKIKKTVKDVSKKFGAHIVTFTELNTFFWFSGNVGPILTYNSLNLNNDLKFKLRNINNWSYSLGDLELF